MTNFYQLQCHCGHSNSVKLHEAGTTKTCAACQAAFSVPSSIKLQQLAGEKDPHASLSDKVRQAVKSSASPFDGVCHGCHQKPATVYLPVGLVILDERAVSGDDGDLWVLGRRLQFVWRAMNRRHEQWKTLAFPMYFCDGCNAAFRKRKRRFEMWHAFGATVLLLLLCSIVWYGRTQDDLVALIFFVFWFVFAIALLRSYRRSSKMGNQLLPGYLIEALIRIQWVKDIIEEEDEYIVHVGSADPVSR